MNDLQLSMKRALRFADCAVSLCNNEARRRRTLADDEARAIAETAFEFAEATLTRIRYGFRIELANGEVIETLHCNN